MLLCPLTPYIRHIHTNVCICETTSSGTTARMMRQIIATAVAFACIAGTYGYPKIATGDSGFTPSKNYVHDKDQLAMESNSNETILPSASDKAGRFGFPTYTTDGQTVNNVAPGLYGPVKLDIGGLVLGTIVGLGAFFIFPKIFHVLSSPYGGGYKRSEDEPSVGGATVSEIYRQVSQGLESMNLDQTSCMQRAICTAVQSSPTSSEGIVDAIARNDLVKMALAGTDWDLALKVGKSEESCGLAFPKCPFTVDSVMKPLLKYFYT